VGVAFKILSALNSGSLKAGPANLASFGPSVRESARAYWWISGDKDKQPQSAAWFVVASFR